MRRRSDVIGALIGLVVFGGTLLFSQNLSDAASWFPRIIGAGGVIASAFVLAGAVFARLRTGSSGRVTSPAASVSEETMLIDADHDADELPQVGRGREYARWGAWIGALLLLLYVLPFRLVVALWLASVLRYEAKWSYVRVAFGVAVTLTAFFALEAFVDLRIPQPFYR